MDPFKLIQPYPHMHLFPTSISYLRICFSSPPCLTLIISLFITSNQVILGLPLELYHFSLIQLE